MLFRPPPGKFNGFTVSRDGERILMEATQPQLRQLTILDRQGKMVKSVGTPGFYFEPKFSPDGGRVVAQRRDPKTGDTTYGRSMWQREKGMRSQAISGRTPRRSGPRIASKWRMYPIAMVTTTSIEKAGMERAKKGLGSATPQVRAWNFTTGRPMGRLSRFPQERFSLVPVQAKESALDRKAIEWLRDENENWQGRFSPDMRYMAYLSDETDVDSMELYVRAFDIAKPEAPGSGAPVRVSKSGARGMTNWRADGKELYFLNRDWEVVAVDVSTTPAFLLGASKVLFKLPSTMPGDPDQWKRYLFNDRSSRASQRPSTASVTHRFLRQGFLERGTKRKNKPCVSCLNTLPFVLPAQGTYGNLGKGALRGPNMIDYDGALSKEIPLRGERLHLQFRAEYFNLFNRVNLLKPGRSASDTSGTSVVQHTPNLSNAGFGQITADLAPRIGQLALKLVF